MLTANPLSTAVTEELEIAIEYVKVAPTDSVLSELNRTRLISLCANLEGIDSKTLTAVKKGVLLSRLNRWVCVKMISMHFIFLNPYVIRDARKV